MINSCPVCGGTLETLYQAYMMPTTSHQLCSTAVEALNVQRGDLDFAYCCNCTFICNRAFDPALVAYNQAYDNCTTHSEAFKEHIQNVTVSIVNKLMGQRVILEIGAGDGEFLSGLVRQIPWDASGIGFDPAYKGHHPHPRVYMVPTMWDNHQLGADVVVARHLIEHIQDPLAFMSRVVANVNPDPTVILETPNSDWIVRNNVFWDLFYEHCSIFNPESMTSLMDRLGLFSTYTESVFDDQFMLTFARSGRARPSTGETLYSEYRTFNEVAQKKINALKTICRTFNGKVGIWGIGAKGVTVANLLPHDYFTCGFELNPNKVGKFVPGRGLPIYHADTINDHDVKAILLMNPNYKPETLERLARLNSKVEVIEL